MTRFPVAGPSITDREISYVTQAVKEAWYDNANMFHQRFESAFASHCGRKYAVSLPSCTSGLHLALLALGVGRDDEVIVPDTTWIASVAPVAYVGATPVFADIDDRSWCLSPEAFERAITPRTKAAIVVDLYGSMPNWERLKEIAASRNVVLIEDAAEAIGSLWNGRRAGAFGSMSAFSFHGSKTLTTGEGGMLVLDDDALLERILVARDHGRRPGDIMFFNQEVGYKYKMSSMQAALGLAQLERIDELVGMKRQIFDWYREELSEWNSGWLTPDIEGLYNSYWMVTLILDSHLRIGKETLVTALRDRGVDARPFFHPLSELPAFRNTPQAEIAHSRNLISYAISPYGINLPSALSLTREDVQKVCSILREVIAALSR